MFSFRAGPISFLFCRHVPLFLGLAASPARTPFPLPRAAHFLLPPLATVWAPPRQCQPSSSSRTASPVFVFEPPPSPSRFNLASCVKIFASSSSPKPQGAVASSVLVSLNFCQDTTDRQRSSMLKFLGVCAPPPLLTPLFDSLHHVLRGACLLVARTVSNHRRPFFPKTTRRLHT